jgi:hypothetical protein
VIYNLLLVKVSASTIRVHIKQCHTSAHIPGGYSCDYRRHLVSVNCVCLRCGSQKEGRGFSNKGLPRELEGSSGKGMSLGGRRHPLGNFLPVSCKRSYL